MNKTSTLYERLLQYSQLKDIKNIPDLAAHLGYSSPEKLYRLKRQPESKPSFDIIEDLTNKFADLDVRWLITGEESPVVSAHIGGVSRAETPHYRIVPPGESPNISDGEMSYSIYPTPQKRVHSKKDVPATVPPTRYLSPQIITVDQGGRDNILYVPVRARAGYLTGYADREYMETLPAFSMPGLTGKTYRAFEVEGDSMYPTLESKEMVIGEWVESFDHIREDRVHAIVTKNEGVIIKRLLNRIDRYGYIIAKSDSVNDRNLYPNIEIHPDDVLEIWYAVWHGGFNFKAPGDLWKRQSNLEADITDIMRRLKQAGI